MADITAGMVKELRQRTGLGMMECKKALVEANGDIELAIEELRKSSGMKAAKKAGPVIMEPVMRVEVVCPKDNLGDVMGDLASRRGRIQSQEDRGGTQIISARVPLSDMFGYATDLRSRTQGRATYSMHFDRYEQAPPDISEEVVARIQGK